MLKLSRLANIALWLAFMLSATLIPHFLYSHLGFNPTDDGFVLAGAKRIVEGQSPHRDFISIRPVGSFILHVPEILFGSDYTIWLGRLVVWFQFAIIALAWTFFVSQTLGVFRSRLQKLVLATIAFVLTAHFFPIMPWHSTDAFFAASAGIFLASRQSRLSKTAGYLFIGASPLFRQNFLLLVPISLLLLDDWREWKCWLAAALPALLYSAYAAINHALPAAIAQITANGSGELLRFGVGRYLYNSGTAWGILFGLAAAGLLGGKFKLGNVHESWAQISGLLACFVLPPGVALTLFAKPNQFSTAANLYAMQPAFVLFGAVLGIVIYSAYSEQKLDWPARYGLLVLAVAWSVSISRGYNTPALAAGALSLFIIGYALSNFTNGGHPPAWLSKFVSVLLVFLLIIGVAGFHFVRENNIMLDLPAKYLTKDLGDVLPGGKLIKTNENTYNILADLQQAKKTVAGSGKSYIVLFDFAATWAQDPQANPLPSDWPQAWELAGQESRVERALEYGRGKTAIIISKYDIYSAAKGLFPVHPEESEVGKRVIGKFNKTAETEFFTIYS